MNVGPERDRAESTPLPKLHVHASTVLDHISLVDESAMAVYISIINISVDDRCACVFMSYHMLVGPAKIDRINSSGLAWLGSWLADVADVVQPPNT